MDETGKSKTNFVDWERIGSTTDFINSVRAVLRRLVNPTSENDNDDEVEVITTVHGVSDLRQFIQKRPDLQLKMDDVITMAREDYKQHEKFDDLIMPGVKSVPSFEDSEDAPANPPGKKPLVN